MAEETLTESLARKLNPRQFTAMSGRMAALLAFVLGQTWTEPRIAWLSITSDGDLVSDSVFIGAMADFERNFESLAILQQLEAEEVAEFWRLFYDKTDDWRPEERA